MTANSSIKAIFFDFGGVITSSPFEAFNRFERAHGLPENFIRQVNSQDPDTNAWARLERNQITTEAFSEAFFQESQALGHGIDGKAILPLLAGDLRPAMVKAIKILKQHYQVACLTNNVNTGHGPNMQPGPKQAKVISSVMALFDFVLESRKAGVRKPDPAFYEMACRQAQVSPESVIFLDDLGINLKPARAMGMTTIKVISEQQALQDLGSLTGLALTSQQ